ncbi:fumarylacetoacetate hydrolase family protein [Novosphingobium sp.]|uniref:fumarylacetoacetate hydrolase family protein n=1 Tax=Novosphingobium sp. TaxID=1874826 RepID=UPI00286E6072|nr:fumarylacetoacetate hydrolase family protein [Novosphingobium sp.]
MPDLLFSLPAIPAVPVRGTDARFPVHRIFCVGRNYEAHAQEMGTTADREAPFYFTKSPAALTLTGASVPYAPGTADLHHEMELVVAIGAPGFEIAPARAMDHVFGYACGLDMTRRDLQNAAKAKQRPWDTGKDFENAAIIAAITPAAEFGELANQRIWLSVNGEVRQDQTLADLVWSVPELIADLSKYYHLQAGDLIYTGTPAGVGPVVRTDRLHGGIDGLDPVEILIVA